MLIPVLASREKKVGEITKGQLTTVALGAGLFLTWGIIKKMLCKLSIYPGDCSGADAAEADPDSAWSPKYWTIHGDVMQ